MKFAHLYRPVPTNAEGGQSPARPVLGAVHDENAVFLEDLLQDAPRDLQDLIERGPDEAGRVGAAVEAARADGTKGVPVSGLRHASAVLRPPVILAVGLNYAAHSAELALRADTKPTIFSLWPNSLAGDEATVTWPQQLSDQVDYEAELGVIIGSLARNVSAEDALGYVFGYTVVNDITARNIQFSEAQWSRCKSFDGFTPTGPVVVSADEIPDPQKLWLTTNVNGKVLQDAGTSDMVRTVAELISYLSQSTTLLPGTLISTGSPGGAGYSRKPQVFLTDGSTVTITIDAIGSLTTHCLVA